MKFAAVSVIALAGLAIAAPRPGQAQVAGFPDVPKTHWAADSVAHLAALGILQGGSATPVGTSAPAKEKGSVAAPAYNGNKPVTRYELAVTLYRFVQYVEHARGQGKTKFGAEALPSDGPTAIKRLIAEGYLPKTTPLAAEGGKPVTADQFSDALAAVMTYSMEKMTPISPDLKDQPPIEKPDAAPKG